MDWVRDRSTLDTPLLRILCQYTGVFSESSGWSCRHARVRVIYIGGVRHTPLPPLKSGDDGWRTGVIEVTFTLVHGPLSLSAPFPECIYVICVEARREKKARVRVWGASSS